MPTRSNDPVYLDYVGRLFQQIGAQVRGQLWKDDGPIIGVQLENEYHSSGPGAGPGHISALKELALRAGFDVPLYTVTAWDNAIYPARAVIPMFGGYPDMPWGVSPSRLPPNEVYAFRFQTRITGDLTPNVLSATAAGDAGRDEPHTPFLAAEYGGGLPSMYRRRTVVSPDDIASMLTVQVGSGVNLYGYYMFHGGRNPAGVPTREENTAQGGYNDLPLLDYDFQAPLGAYGQQHAVLSKLRPMHYFLDAFGSDLAPMVIRRPERTPSGLDDLSSPRIAVRRLGDSGFLFVNNHVRLYSMPVQRQVRFEVALAHQRLEFPSTPIDVPADSYFVWPINMNLDGAGLVYATAQPVTRIRTDEGPVYVFRAVDGIPVEFAFDAATVRDLTSASGHLVRSSSGAGRPDGTSWMVVKGIRPGTGKALAVTSIGGAGVHVLVLAEAQAERLWVVNFKGRDHLLLFNGADRQVFADADALELRAVGDPDFKFGLFPAVTKVPTANLPVHSLANDGLFQMFEARDAVRTIPLSVEQLRQAQSVPPVMIGGPARAAVQPAPEVFGKSAAWTLTISPGALSASDNAFLQIDYVGDVGRLFRGAQLIDDNYYNGLMWEVGLRDVALEPGKLVLTVLPLRSDAPIYLEDEFRRQLVPGAQVAQIRGVKIVPEYRLRMQ
jgi:beta-galactosidase